MASKREKNSCVSVRDVTFLQPDFNNLKKKSRKKTELRHIECISYASIAGKRLTMRQFVTIKNTLMSVNKVQDKVSVPRTSHTFHLRFNLYPPNN